MTALSREHARAFNDRVVANAAAKSSVHAGWLQVQASALESYDRWAQVPAALAIRAYTNREFGLDLTPEAVRRVRGRVCEVLDVDTAAADALPLSRVAEVFRHSDSADRPATATRPPRSVG